MADKRKLDQDADLMCKRSKSSSSPSSFSSLSDSDSESIHDAYVLTFFNNLKQNLLTIPHDLTFVLAGGRQIHAHKILVLNSSAFFSNFAKLSEPGKVCIHFSNIKDHESFEFCLNFIQNGRIGYVSYDKIYGYTKMANLLKLTDLAEYLSALSSKCELNASYKNLQAILTTFYANICQTFNKINHEMDNLKNVLKDVENFEFDIINKDFMIKEKYMYYSELVDERSMNSYLENYKYLSIGNCLDTGDECGEKFKRWCLVMFSLEKTSCNYVIKSRLNFTEINVLKQEISDLLEYLLSRVTNKKFQMQINRICYLKKPTNCKAIKLQSINTSTDCFRAIVEYSKLNSNQELPFVLLTCHSSIKF